ncbi:MAG: aminotransferase class I/II-fold pyridoxal phosphate-dependent enzyme [Verrucomicrobiota bacterium]
MLLDRLGDDLGRELSLEETDAARVHQGVGAFYAFPKVSGTGLDSLDFARRLLEERKVAMVPGTAFGAAGAGFCRASFSTSYERIHEACERIARFLDDVRRA